MSDAEDFMRRRKEMEKLYGISAGLFTAGFLDSQWSEAIRSIRAEVRAEIDRQQQEMTARHRV